MSTKEFLLTLLFMGCAVWSFMTVLHIGAMLEDIRVVTACADSHVVTIGERHVLSCTYERVKP